MSSLLHTAIVWYISTNLAAIFVIIKYRKLHKTELVQGVIFGVICMISSFSKGVAVIFPYLAARMIYEESKTKITVCPSADAQNKWRNIRIVIIAGVVLSTINVLLGLDSMSVHISFKLSWITDALRARIYEEIVQNRLCYVIMVLPHVLTHFNLQAIGGMNIIVLSLLFGFPFAWLQRKETLLSAIGVHTVVDFIRFSVLGV